VSGQLELSGPSWDLPCPLTVSSLFDRFRNQIVLGNVSGIVNLPSVEAMRDTFFSHTAPLLACALGMAVSLSGCQMGGHKDSTAEDSSAPVVSLPLTRVKQEDFQHTVSLPGTVVALPDHSIKVSPAIAGKLVAVYVVPGEHISRGQVIAELDSRQLTQKLNEAIAAVSAGEQAVAQAQTAIQVAQDSFDRYKKLLDEKIAAKKDVVAASGQLKTAEEQQKAAAANVNQLKAAQANASTQLAFTRVHSPIDGVVADRLLNTGDTTDTNSPIIHVVDIKQVIITANLPADLPAQIDIGQAATVTSSAMQGRVLPATVQSISPSVDLPTNTLPIRLVCNNATGLLKEGEAVTISIVTGVHHGALTVPQSAVVPDPEQTNGSQVYVFHDKDDTVSSVQVKLGAEAGGRVEVLSGLLPGQTVVARGAYGLPDGTRIETVGANMAGTGATGKLP